METKRSWYFKWFVAVLSSLVVFFLFFSFKISENIGEKEFYQIVSSMSSITFVLITLLAIGLHPLHYYSAVFSTASYALISFPVILMTFYESTLFLIVLVLLIVFFIVFIKAASKKCTNKHLSRTFISCSLTFELVFILGAMLSVFLF